MTKVLILILVLIASVCSSQNYIFGDANNGVHIGNAYQLGDRSITTSPGFTLFGRLTCDVGFTWTTDNSYRAIRPRISYMYTKQGDHGNILSVSSMATYQIERRTSSSGSDERRQISLSGNIDRQFNLGSKVSVFIGGGPVIQFYELNSTSSYTSNRIGYNLRAGIRMGNLYGQYDHYKPNMLNNQAGISNITIGTFFGR